MLDLLVGCCPPEGNSEQVHSVSVVLTFPGVGAWCLGNRCLKGFLRNGSVERSLRNITL